MFQFFSYSVSVKCYYELCRIYCLIFFHITDIFVFLSYFFPIFSHTPRPRLLRSRAGTPNSVPDSPRSLESRTARISRPTTTNSPVKSRISHLNSTGYDSDDSVRLDRVNHTAMKQDIMSIKTMLLKLRRVLNEVRKYDAVSSLCSSGFM